MRPDYLIVGSGISALSFGALMARSGKRVRILEAHEHPGGYGHTFAFGSDGKAVRFNAQLHYTWNCGPGQPVNDFLRKLGLHDEVTFERFDPNGFDHMRMPGYQLDVPNDWELLGQRLQGQCPEHAAQIAAFLEEVRGTEQEIAQLPPPPRALRMLPRLHKFTRMIRYRNATLQDVFDRFELPLPAQTLLALQWPDFLLPPNQLSYFAWVQLFTGYMNGAYYPTRHFEHLIENLVGCIENAGGEVLLGRRVVDFILKDGVMMGVVAATVDKNGVETGERTEYTGREIVSNMDPRRTAEMVGIDHFSAAVRKSLNYEYSPSNYMAYCAVEGLDLREHGFGKHNLFHAEDPDLNRSFHNMYRLGDYSRPSFAMTTPSLLTDVPDSPDNVQLVELLTVADHQRFSALKFSNAKAYRKKKAEVFDAMVDIVERDYVPNFRKHLTLSMTGSPTTNERFVLSPAGNSYGANMTPAQWNSRVAHESSVEHLWFCNATAGYPGMVGAIWTGCNLYAQISGDSVYSGPHLAGS